MVAANSGETSPEVAALAARLMHHDDPDVRRVAASALRQAESDEPPPVEPTPPADPTAELDALRAKLSAREGQPGFEQNVQAIKARIAELVQ